MRKKLSGVVHGDLHLEKFNSWFPKEIASDPLGLQLASITAATELARKRDTKNVFLTGDIFDTAAPKQDSIARFLKLLAEHPDINFYMYLGNHDIASKDRHALVISDFVSKSKIISNVFCYVEPTMTKIDGFPVLFMPYGHFYEPDTAFLGFGHTGVIGGKNDNGTPISGDAPEPKNRKAKWIMGHIHLQQETKRAYFPGTAYQTNFGEKLPKYLMYFEAAMLKGRVVVKRDYIKAKPRFKLKEYVILTNEDFEKVPVYYKKITPVFVKLKLAKGLTMPRNFRAQRANIIKTDPIRADGSALVITTPDEAPKSVRKFTPTTGLKKYLIDKHGMTKDRADLAKAFVRKLLN